MPVHAAHARDFVTELVEVVYLLVKCSWMASRGELMRFRSVRPTLAKTVLVGERPYYVGCSICFTVGLGNLLFAQARRLFRGWSSSSESFHRL